MMIRDTYAKLSPLTLIFHWTIALFIIGALSFGFYIHNLPRAAPEKLELLLIHKNIGIIIFLLALSRIIWRYMNGFFQPAGEHKAWERKSAVFVHLLLLTGTVLMPISGMMMTLGYACSVCTVPVFWLFEIGPLPEKIDWIAITGQRIHGLGGRILSAALLIHAAAALKHHYWDRDDTLRRMLGQRIGL